MKYKIGDKVRVIKATSGCMGAEGSIGVVTDKKSTDGLLDYRDGFNIELKNGKIWRIGFESVCEPVEDELTAEEAIKIQAEICSSTMCKDCEIEKLRYVSYCNCIEFRSKNPEKVIEILKQRKKEHEKKPIETESVGIVRVIEDTGDIKKCVYEEELTERENPMDAKERVLKEYCQNHAGKFFTVFESICRVKE